MGVYGKCGTEKVFRASPQREASEDCAAAGTRADEDASQEGRDKLAVCGRKSTHTRSSKSRKNSALKSVTFNNSTKSRRSSKSTKSRPSSTIFEHIEIQSVS